MNLPLLILWTDREVFYLGVRGLLDLVVGLADALLFLNQFETTLSHIVV